MSETPLRSPARVRRALGAVLMLAAIVVGATACSAPEPEVHEYVIPSGTQDRLAKGERVEVWTGQLTVRVGDTLRVRNEDVVSFPFGPYRVPALDTFEIVFGAAGVYQGECPLVGDADTYTLVVTE